ncbi:MAG: glutamate formiminotransferase [Firmicutes bacterium]|nr:glutamate formiminotransferase [Bacillota bacterium]
MSANYIIRSIPNFSTSCESVVEKIAQAFKIKQDKDMGGAIYILDYSLDKDHNRSVFTIESRASTLEACFSNLTKAYFGVFEIALKHIDLTKHKGVHPRIGAIDVIPFVPIENVTTQQAVEFSKVFAGQINQKFNVPVFLYEKSAKSSERQNLADIRKNASVWLPDYTIRESGLVRGAGFVQGESLVGDGLTGDLVGDNLAPHKTFGAVAIGVRQPLIAYNVLLDTGDVRYAKKIARAVRERDGGLKGVKALGLFLQSKNKAQVSCNITDTDANNTDTVYAAIQKEASKLGVKILSAELIGLLPNAHTT